MATARQLAIAALLTAVVAVAHADIGTSINSCVSALPATGGVCDFRSMGRTTAAATITLSKPVTLLLDGTQITLDGNPGIKVQGHGITIKGAVYNTQLIEGASGEDVVSGSTVSSLDIEGIAFVGQTCSEPTCTSSAIHLYNSSSGDISQIRIVGNTFSTFCLHAIQIQNATDVVVDGNVISAVADGIRFSGVIRGAIVNNIVHDQLFESGGADFGVAIALDSTNPDPCSNISYPVSADIHIANNTVYNYSNGEGILVHAGLNVTISGNALDNVLMGIGVNKYNTTDNLSNVTITGNKYLGALTSGNDKSASNYGIFVGGTSSSNSTAYVVIANNTVSQANRFDEAAAQGGIGLGFADNVTVIGNIIDGTYNNGITLINANSNLLINENYIYDAWGTNQNGIYGYTGIQSGRIRSNFVTSSTNGYNFTSGIATSADLLFGTNDSSSVTTALINNGGVTVTAY